jgi:hypothetical protein
VATIRADLASMGLTEFSRAFLNLWPDPLGEGWQVFDEAKWKAARDG